MRKISPRPGSNQISVEVAVDAIRRLMAEQGWTLPEAVAEIVTLMDAGSQQALIDYYKGQ
jgi:hypothetical protein